MIVLTAPMHVLYQEAPLLGLAILAGVPASQCFGRLPWAFTTDVRSSGRRSVFSQEEERRLGDPAGAIRSGCLGDSYNLLEQHLHASRFGDMDAGSTGRREFDDQRASA